MTSVEGAHLDGLSERGLWAKSSVSPSTHIAANIAFVLSFLTLEGSSF